MRHHRDQEELVPCPPAPGALPRWPRAVRLRKRRDFVRVQRSGRRIRGAHLVVCFAPAQASVPRFGLTVSRKVGNAVVRNRVKRWLRESLRHRRGAVASRDVVVIALPSSAGAGAAALDRDLARCLDRIGRAG